MWKGMNQMNLTRAAGAGTDKSGDVLVWAEPGGSPVQIEVESSVADLFGGAILAAVQETAAACGVTAGRIRIQDKGALDYVIRARVETALRRSGGEA